MKLLSRLGSLLDGGLPLLLCLLALLAGYTHGRDTAEQERGRAEAVAAAEKSARERLAAATERGDKLAAELANTTRALDAARVDLNRRIRHVSETARRDCPGLPAEWVRLYNEALGLAETGPDHSAGGGSSGSGGAADASGSAGAAGAGIQPDALTTPEDVLAHIRDYGHYCRRMEAGYRALITLHNGDSP